QVNVDVYSCRIHRKKQNIRRLPVAVQHVGISLANGMRDGPVLDIAAIYIQVPAVCAAARKCGPAYDTLKGYQAMCLFYAYALRYEFPTQYIPNALRDTRGSPLALRFVIV